MTTHIAWKPFYSVGEPSLDAQHKQILGIVSALYAAMEQGRDCAVMEGLLDRLCRYTNTHFKHEEQIMRECDYPGFAQHKAMHERLRQRTADLRAHATLVTAPDLLRFLKEWWMKHIQDIDKNYAPYLAARIPS
jgi:hemerythrin-like metal-binding protein